MITDKREERRDVIIKQDMNEHEYHGSWFLYDHGFFIINVLKS